MICGMALRFNGGDMIHEVPHVLNADGTKSYSRWEALLGQKASHGCVRTQRRANEDGLNAQWLWDNLKRNTKVLVWDDKGRKMPYPDDDLELFYNPEGGQYYHADAYCSSVRDQYLPLTGFTYAELDRYIRTGEIDDADKKANIDRRHRLNLFKLQLMPAFKPKL